MITESGFTCLPVGDCAEAVIVSVAGCKVEGDKFNISASILPCNIL